MLKQRGYSLTSTLNRVFSLSLGGREGALRRLNDADNDAKQAERRTENLNDQHLDEETVLLRVRDGARCAAQMSQIAVNEKGGK